MAQFILVANGVTNENFEKAMEVKIRSGAKITFVPQHSQQHGVTSSGMSSTKGGSQQATADLLNTIRFEWNRDGEEFGAELVRVLAGHRKEEETRHEPAA